MKQIYILLSIAFTSLTFAQVPANYYDSANGLTEYTLKTQLKKIIDNSNDGLTPEFLSVDPGYGGLYNTYLTSDVDLYYENNGSVLDMYTENPTGMDIHEYYYNSNPSQQDMGTGGTAEGQFYNREHTIPQYTFNSATPMQSDAHFVVPSDKYVNGQRGNLPFGNVATASNTYSNGTKRGTSGITGYSGNVFEPIDEFKGDIARMHFYFATRYENNVAGYNYDMFNNTSDQVFSNAFLDLLLQWHTGDPVSTREIDRNNAIFNNQNNRNPYIDHPEYVNAIWNPMADTQAPTVPTNLAASNPTSSTVDLSWTASTDDTAVTSYDVYVDGVFYINTGSNAITYTVNGLASETTYSFTILAVDAAGNTSSLSTSDSATTLAGGATGTDCVNEDFENIPVNSGSYSTRTWTGIDGIANGWAATDARTDQTLNTRAICIRNGTLTSPVINGGIGDLTVTTQLTFSGSAGTFDVLVNAVSVGSIPYSADNTSPTTTTIPNINIEGIITLVLDNQSSTNRVRIDDLSWTCYSSLNVEDFNINTFKIYPNPVKGNLLTIEVGQNTRFEIYDILGKKILDGNVTPTNKDVSVSRLNKGVYIIKLETANGSISKKLIKS